MAIEGNFLSPTTEQVDPNTSGWAADTNCAISLGSGGRNGDGCLTITSLAAGEMIARTASSYPARAGEEYFAFADASGSTVPERIGIRWRDGEGQELGVTWSETTAAASSLWHRISVVGIAPAGAVASAQVLISATPAAADVVTFAENVYLGRPKRTENNLLSFNAESGGELDLSSWAAEANTGIARVVPVFSWSVDWYYGGGHVIEATAQAAGDCSVVCTERAPVTEGADYAAYAYLGPMSTTSNIWVELRFYDAAGVQIAAARSHLAQPGTGLYRQIASGIAPAGAVSASIAGGITGAAAGDWLLLEGAVVRSAWPLWTGSVVPYADASFEQGPAGWSVASGPALLGRSSPWGAHELDGSYALEITSGAGTSVLASARYPIIEGVNWHSRLSVRPDVGVWTIDAAVRWYDAAGLELGVDGNTGAATITDNGAWWAYFMDALAPAGAVEARAEWTVTSSAAGSVLHAESAILVQAMPRTSIDAVDDTASVTLTLRELDLDELITLWRVEEGGGRSLVRGPHGLYERAPITSDQLIVEDYEAPLGVPVSYYAEFHYVSTGVYAGSIGTQDVTITPGDVQEAWIKDPGNPQRNTRFLIRTAPDWTRGIPQSEHRVRGRRNAVVLSDVRSGLEGDLALFTRTDDERRRLHWLLDDGNVLLWQATPGMGVDDMYVNVGEVAEARDGDPADEPWRAWQLPLKQADMPRAVGVNGSAGRTWNDVLVEHESWDDVLTSYATWEDVLLGQRKEP